MYRIQRSRQFLRDLEKLKRQKKDLRLLQNVVDLLCASDEPLPREFGDHPLKAAEKGFRECSIKDDWLLKYYKDRNVLVLVLSRTGTLQDLFGED